MSTANRICPRCGKPYTDRPAISKTDSKTEICLVCSILEVLEVAGVEERARRRVEAITRQWMAGKQDQ